MKHKRIIAIISSIIIASSMLTLTASAANTDDTYYTYTWTSSQRYDFTPTRYKYDITPVYQ